MSLFGKILLWGWFGIFCICFLFAELLSHGSDALLPGYAPFIVIGVFVLPFIIYVAVSNAFDKKKEKKYREKNIRSFELRTERFGLLKFEHDTLKNTLEFKEGKLPKFGEGQIEKITIYDYDNNCDLIISAICTVFERENEILDGFIEPVKSTYDEFEITEFEGQPITDEFIRSDIRMDTIEINLLDNCFDLEINGGMNTEIQPGIWDEQWLIARIEGSTGELECSIE